MSDVYKKCKRPCKYRSSTPSLNGCDYMYLTRKCRDCPPGDSCTRFEEGERIKDPSDPTKLPSPNAERDLQREIYNYMKIRRDNLAEYKRKVFM